MPKKEHVGTLKISKLFPDNQLQMELWRKESDVWDIHFKQPYSEITGALMHEAVVGDMEQYMNFVKEIGQPT